MVTNYPVSKTHPNMHIYSGIMPYTPAWHELYQRAHMFVMPTYADPLGQVFMEAMAYGLPVVGTHVGGVPELIREGETGFLVQPGDHEQLAVVLQALINNPRKVREMGNYCKIYAQDNFDSEKNFFRNGIGTYIIG